MNHLLSSGGANPADLEMPLNACIARRAETGSVFNRHFFDNRMLWLALTAVVAASVLLLEEVRKLVAPAISRGATAGATA